MLTLIFKYNRHHVYTAHTPPLQLPMIHLNMGTEEMSVNEREKKVTCVQICLKKYISKQY